MEQLQNPDLQRDFIREKHRTIYRKYLDLLEKEKAENALRAKHIGKRYYADVVAQSMTPPMDANYILRVINNQMREGDNRY